MSCQVEQIADCGDISTLARALFVPERDNANWLSHCCVSLSSCGNLLCVGNKNRLCLLNSQWISSTDSNTFLISWSGTLPSDITVVFALSICPSLQSSQNGPDWFCIIVGFTNGNVGFYNNTGHLLLMEKLDDTPVVKISCHTGTYGTLPDDIHILYQTCECIVSGSSLFQMLRNAKTQLARVQAGLQDDYSVDNQSINVRKWVFTEQEVINDAAVVGLELKNTYDHLLAASTFGGYDVWYRSIPPVNTLVLGAGINPYVGFHYALEGGATPPLHDVAKAVANRIKSALPGWLGGGTTDNSSSGAEPLVRAESLSMRNGLYDAARHGSSVAVSPDRRLAALVDTLGRVAVLDVTRGHLIRLFKGYRDAQCAFIQIFEKDDKKPQLSTIKEIRRALFLIIYNPKKGLIDIRLMQKGNRVAVFTATKNGRLIYNTCGLVGAEKPYSHKKLNLPEFQCVLIDPDGKLKKFSVPFFYALEGEHSEKSKDFHILRELRDYMKKMSTSDDYETDFITKAAALKTLELKKHCLEISIRNYEIPAKTVMSLLEAFWTSLENKELDTEEQKIKHYFANLGLITLFYRQINNDATDDMSELVAQIHQYLELDCEIVTNEKESTEPVFELLEDDNCILERLLILAQESNYGEQQHARVSFADSKVSTYKEFVSCFSLNDHSKYIFLKKETSTEKLRNLASDTFKSLFKIKDLQMLSKFIKESNVDPKEILKLVIIHLMNMPLEEFCVDLITKLIQVSYYVCKVTEEATRIDYNELSPWWESIRDILVDMPCPLKSMVIAMAFKATSALFENKSTEEEAWESLTKESAKWGLLIGKLEDISLLSIILMFKDTFKGKSLPKIYMSDVNINLKYIYTRGKGSVTELITKWLCSMGVPPEAIVVNELLEKYSDLNDPNIPDEEGNSLYLIVENNRVLVDENANIFKWLSLLRRQFPLSTTANYIIANMCWEYAIAWQKDIQTLEHLAAVVDCLKNISDLHLRTGLLYLIWSTYLRSVFEATCRLVHKVGKLPKEPLCLQGVGLSNSNVVKFLEVATDFLELFTTSLATKSGQEKTPIIFEKIWDESAPSLVEVAQDAKNINEDILSLNYQMCCTIYYQCHFNLKFSKPLDTLYDVDYQYVIEALTGNGVERKINMKASDRIQNPRLKFITKLIRASIETITCSDSGQPHNVYNSEECTNWIEKIMKLSDLWDISEEFVRRQQVIGLFHLGYDMLAENMIGLLKDPEMLLPPLLAIATQRFKRSLESSSNQAEWIVTIPPHLYKRLQNMVLDPSIPAHPSLTTTAMVLQKVIFQLQNKSKDPSNVQNVKLAELMIQSCEVLIRRKL